MRRRGDSSSAGEIAGATGAATVSMNTSGSLGATSRLRRRAGRVVARNDVLSSIWSTSADAVEVAVSTRGAVATDVAYVGAGSGIAIASADRLDAGD